LTSDSKTLKSPQAVLNERQNFLFVKFERTAEELDVNPEQLSTITDDQFKRLIEYLEAIEEDREIEGQLVW